APVTRARTRSPGSAWRTNTTRPPGCLATHQPPCATSSTASSSRPGGSPPAGPPAALIEVSTLLPCPAAPARGAGCPQVCRPACRGLSAPGHPDGGDGPLDRGPDAAPAAARGLRAALA